LFLVFPTAYIKEVSLYVRFKDKVRSEKKKILYSSIILLTLITTASIAAIYIYRQANFSITVNDYTQATGVALTGFYNGGNNLLITLTAPNGSRTYGNNHLMIYYTGPIGISDDGSHPIKMYSTANIVTNITQGGWVFEHVINFGVSADPNGNSVTSYIILKVKHPSSASQAELDCYKIMDGGPNTNRQEQYIGTLDLTNQSDIIDPHGTITISGSNRLSYTCNLTLTYDQATNDYIEISIYQQPT